MSSVVPTIDPYFKVLNLLNKHDKCTICTTNTATERWLIKSPKLAYPVEVKTCNVCKKGPQGVTYHENLYGVKM